MGMAGWKTDQVFPAQAGVSLCDTCRCNNCLRLPRASGGEPHGLLLWIGKLQSSPRKRG